MMPVPDGPAARIVDRGYRRYDGPRLGPAGAQRSLIRHTAQRVLGLRRPARAKVLPVLAAVIAYVPAIVFIGLAALLDIGEFIDVIPTYAEYYGFVVSAIIVFVAFVAPEALCPDRRTGLFGLYLAAPLTRNRYVVAKAIAVAGLLAISTIGPPLLLLVANIIQGLGPDGPVDIAVLLFRILVAGVVVTAVLSAVSLGISSLTDRRAFAAAGVILVLLVTGVVANALVEAEAPAWLLALSLADAPFELVYRIFGERGNLPEVDTVSLAAGQAGWFLLGSAVLWYRHQRFVVTR
jgi:ABC-2 type transport system permease protein